MAPRDRTQAENGRRIRRRETEHDADGFARSAIVVMPGLSEGMISVNRPGAPAPIRALSY
jgi:hypothetical protein